MTSRNCKQQRHNDGECCAAGGVLERCSCATEWGRVECMLQPAAGLCLSLMSKLHVAAIPLPRYMCAMRSCYCHLKLVDRLLQAACAQSPAVVCCCCSCLHLSGRPRRSPASSLHGWRFFAAQIKNDVGLLTCSQQAGYHSPSTVAAHQLVDVLIAACVRVLIVQQERRKVLCICSTFISMLPFAKQCLSSSPGRAFLLFTVERPALGAGLGCHVQRVS